MGTVDKALSLLAHFSPQIPEVGLSDLARAAGLDKTTTLRCMTALERNGFVEKDAQSRKYRIGLAPLHLAQLRERSFPVQAVLEAHLRALARGLQETAHSTLVIGETLMTSGIAAPERALFVHLDPGQALPWHATASGLAIMAFLPEAEQARRMAEALERFTARTPVTPEQIAPLLAACRRDGLARVRSGFEEDVCGTAAPIFGSAGAPIGAIAVAAVQTRLDAQAQTRIDAALRGAARAITDHMGGRAPDTLNEDA